MCFSTALGQVMQRSWQEGATWDGGTGRTACLKRSNVAATGQCGCNGCRGSETQSRITHAASAQHAETQTVPALFNAPAAALPTAAPPRWLRR